MDMNLSDRGAVCPKCGSQNVNVQVVTESKLVNKRHGCLWWMFVGLWWVPIKWVLFTVPALIAKVFFPKRQRLEQSTRSVCVCQGCGHHWKA